MTDDLVTLIVQASGQLSGIVLRSTLNSIPGLIGVAAGAPITLLVTGLAAIPGMIIALWTIGILK